MDNTSRMNEAIIPRNSIIKYEDVPLCQCINQSVIQVIIEGDVII